MKASVLFGRAERNYGEQDIISMDIRDGKVTELKITEFRKQEDGTVMNTAPKEMDILLSRVTP